MKEPYYMIDFNAAACLFEIRVNDQPILTMNLHAQASTILPINYVINKNGKQEVTIKMLPLLGETQLSPKAKFSFNIKLYDTVKNFELKNQFSGFESKEVKEKVIPSITNKSFFDAKVNYKLKNYWLDGKDIEDIEDYNIKLKHSYLRIIKIIKSGNFDLFSKKLKNREYNMSTSMYLNSNDSKKRITSIVNNLKNGYDHVIFPENVIPIISAYGKKVSLKKTNGEPALAFGNKEKQEQIMLDIEFYFNKQTNSFEII
ncbi:hypothetical protein DZC78_04155 [Olleya aquimaris]|uniref:Uncharacterized protein n=1 Tax=Olleya sediminilitoris TaxID=2795739 RepID=A0ABS1WKB8_9FLAO|nr:hypothetical protein [Olleya sediminilitoris]AXO79617.1 hypothetical protein DZC78_04155 [Olleya aquimaris]MBL7559569.1 hypothetical protein [Olleya sediminilitoris]